MSVKYIWGIPSFYRDEDDDFIYNINYNVHAKDGEYFHDIAGTVVFDRPDELIPFKELTQDTVINWIKTKLDTDSPGTVSKIESDLLKHLNGKRTTKEEPAHA